MSSIMPLHSLTQDMSTGMPEHILTFEYMQHITCQLTDKLLLLLQITLVKIH